MSRVNKIRFLVQRESGECKCGLNERIYNSKQKWNPNEYRRECKELDDWGSCEKGYMWNPSTWDCECYKICKIDEYLNTKTCSCEKRLIGELVLECED